MGALDFINILPTNSCRHSGRSKGRSGRGVSTKPAAALAPLPATLPDASSVDTLPAAARAKAIEKLQFVRLVRQLAQTEHLKYPEAADLAAARYAGAFPLLTRSGKKGGTALTYNNFRNWKSLCGNNDELALRQLADSYRRGIQPARGDYRFWEYFYAFYLNTNKLPVTVAYRRAAAKLRQIAPDAPAPTIAQVRYQLEHLDEATLIYGREGEEACRNRTVDYISRDWSDIAPGFLVVGDSRQFDTRVRIWDEEKSRWIGVRPTIAALIDARSWYFVSYFLTTEPVNADTLICTLALYCRNAGNQPPGQAYFDRGKDYCAQGFATPFDAEGYEHSIFRELGMKLTNSIAYNARAKTIERAFRDMMQQFDKMFPDYLGSRPGQRTDAAGYFDTHPEELPELSQFAEIFDAWLNEHHATPKHGDIHKGKSPAEIWTARPARPEFSPERLRLAFLRPEAVRTVQRGPSITLDRVRYFCDDLKFGEKVLVKSDPFDSTHVIFFAPDGAVIGEGRTRDRIKALALEDPVARAVISKLINRQRRQLADARTTIDRLTGGRRQVSPIELFLADPLAGIVPVGSRRSVKGAAHRYDRVTLPGTITPAAAGMPSERSLPPATGDSGADEEQSHSQWPPELAEFNAFMTERKRADDF